jgi:hypothetical protein
VPGTETWLDQAAASSSKKPATRRRRAAVRRELGDVERYAWNIVAVTTFGTAHNFTLEEPSIEALYPADDVTAAALRG